MSLPLFDQPAPAVTVPYQRSSATSKEAARRARAFIGQQGETVAHWFQARGLSGATQKQCSAALGISRASVCARVNALERAGRLVKTARRIDGCAVYRSRDL
jgi:predicted XRE-type DNA-binding protein